jgi:hypothetical protein
MTPEDSEKELERRIKQSGTATSELRPAQAIRLMLDFYKDIRAEKCELDEGGDMLLFQWGTYDFGEGSFFLCDITRQFIVSHTEDEDDDASISQLSLTFSLTLSPHLDAITNGKRWCNKPDELESFEAFILSSDVYRVVQDLRPKEATLSYGIAG